MAVKKAAGGTKKRDGSSAKKAGGTKGAGAATRKGGSPKKSAGSATKKSAPKAAVKKAGAATTRLSPSQSELLRRIGDSGEGGYRSEKKAEQRSLDSLQEKKLIKRGAKDKASGIYPYSISNAGKKHLGSMGGGAGGGAGGGGAGGGSMSGNA